MKQHFLATIVGSMGGSADLLSQVGVTVAGTPTRAENHVTAGYSVGEHLFITCDPAVESMLVEATHDMLPTLQAWSELAAASGGELLGSGRMQVLDGVELGAAALADGYTLRSLDRTNADDLETITHFVQSSDADDLDDAEIELDNLDDLIEVVLDSAGQIASFASSHDFDMSPGFGDIGIMTRPDSRGLGLGRAAVASLCRRISQAGIEPLYRCDNDNHGSRALCASLGFTTATELIAFRFPT